MKLKVAFISSIFLLIIIACNNIFIKKNIYDKQLILEKCNESISNENDSRIKKKNTIEYILKSLLCFKDMEITNMLVDNEDTLKIEMKFNDISNLATRIEEIEKINGFKGINELKIVNLEHEKYMATLNVSFVK